VAVRSGIIAVRWGWSGAAAAGVGNSPVGAIRVGNSEALPGVVTWVWPFGSLQMTVPSGRW